MKKLLNLISYLSIVILIFCMLNSCRKDAHSDSKTTILTLKQAKAIYDADKQLYTGDPEWEKAFTYSKTDSGLTLKIPLSSQQGIKELVFVQYKDQSIHQYVLYTFPDPNYITEKTAASSHSVKSEDLVNINDFTGIIYKFQTNGIFLGGAIYQTGLVLNYFKPKESSSPTNDGKLKTLSGDDANCNNPKGPWIQYCMTKGMLPPVIITAPPSGGGGPLPPIGTNPPPVIVGGAGGWATNIVLYNNVNGERINNIADYLKCLNRNSSATVTIFVDQPKTNATDTWSGSPLNPEVGHTFVSITQGDITRTYGFYPGNGVNPFTSPSTGSVLINDAGHGYDVSVSIPVNAGQLQAVINTSLNFAKTYNLNSYNCTDFGLSIANAAGISIQSATGSWPGGSGHNPGNFGQDVRNKTLPSAAVKNTNGGNAPQNKGNCQ